MKLLFYLHHPAHFHLFKNTIKILADKGHRCHIISVKKDVLDDLLKQEGFPYKNILPRGRKDNKLSTAFAVLKQDIRLFTRCLFHRPDLLIGTSTEITHIGKLLNIPRLFFNEDDVEAVPLVGKMAYPFAKHIITPDVCSTGKWEKKTVHYPGYHELAYLHPHYFTPDPTKIKKILNNSKPYFIIRFSRLKAYHDKGKKGISDDLARQMIEILKPHGNIYITSERELPGELNPYYLRINPLDMHHALYYAEMVIGDSQTMTAEAAVLGTPALRFNDFVGKLGYLEELEHRYSLTYGIKTSEPEKLFKKIDELLKMKNRKQVWQQRRQEMLKDKIDVTAFIVWLIENYPKSAKEIFKQGGSFRENRPPGPPTKAFD
jgi:predicted glycosyltransferase